MKKIQSRLNVMAAVAMVMAGLTVVATAESAHAARPASCVTSSAWTSGAFKYARGYNGCTSTKRFYHQWSHALDSDCWTRAPRTSGQSRRGLQAGFTGFVSC